MEYLMTYGWAILIIAVVLGALFSLGVFSSANTVSNACIASVGFYCKNLIFSVNVINAYSDPSITVDVGSTTGSVSGSFFIVVPQGQLISDYSLANEGSPNDFWYWGLLVGQYYYTSSFSPGQISNIRIYVSAAYPGLGSRLAIGTKLTGAIWEMYSTASTANALAQVAVFSTAATTR